MIWVHVTQDVMRRIKTPHASTAPGALGGRKALQSCLGKPLLPRAGSFSGMRERARNQQDGTGLPEWHRGKGGKTRGGGCECRAPSQKRVQIYSSNKIHRLLFWGANTWTHEKKLQIPNTSEETAATGSVRYIWPRAGATNKLPRGHDMCSRQAVP